MYGGGVNVAAPAGGVSHRSMGNAPMEALKDGQISAGTLVVVNVGRPRAPHEYRSAISHLLTLAVQLPHKPCICQPTPGKRPVKGWIGVSMKLIGLIRLARPGAGH